MTDQQIADWIKEHPQWSVAFSGDDCRRPIGFYGPSGCFRSFKEILAVLNAKPEPVWRWEEGGNVYA